MFDKRFWIAGIEKLEKNAFFQQCVKHTRSPQYLFFECTRTYTTCDTYIRSYTRVFCLPRRQRDLRIKYATSRHATAPRRMDFRVFSPPTVLLRNNAYAYIQYTLCRVKNENSNGLIRNTNTRERNFRYDHLLLYFLNNYPGCFTINVQTLKGFYASQMPQKKSVLLLSNSQ